MKVFISHSSSDKELAELFVDLLIDMGLKETEVFCSSAIGFGIPEGSDFYGFIEDKLNDATLVIALISPTFNESAFCLAEMGAAWIKHQNFFPILVEPMDYSDLKGVLTPKQGGKLNSVSLDNLRDRIEKSGGTIGNTARWNIKKEQFLKDFKKITITPAKNVPLSKFKGIEEELVAAKQIIDEQNSEIKILKTLNKELEGAKDKASVSRIKRTLQIQDPFERLASNFRDETKKLPNIVLEALFQNQTGRDWSPQREELSEVRAAEERGYLVDKEYCFQVNEKHPQIEKANSLLHEMYEFLEADEEKVSESTFVSEFNENHDFPLSLKIRDFWETYLGLR